MRVKSPGVPPGLANARPPGRAKLAKAPPPGLTRLANAPRLPGGGGGWAQVELTDALQYHFYFLASARMWLDKRLSCPAISCSWAATHLASIAAPPISLAFCFNFSSFSCKQFETCGKRVKTKPSTSNRYVFCFINARSVGFFEIRISLRTELGFPFQRLLSFWVC